MKFEITEFADAGTIDHTDLSFSEAAILVERLERGEDFYVVSDEYGCEDVTCTVESLEEWHITECLENEAGF